MILSSSCLPASFVQDPDQGATLDLTIEDMDDEPIVIEDVLHDIFNTCGNA